MRRESQQRFVHRRLLVASVALLWVIFCGAGIGVSAREAPPTPPNTPLNLRPIIGVLTQPSPSYLAQWGDSYLDADYIKWIETAGGRVVPVPYDANYDVLNDIFSWVNGILYTGGGLYLGPNNTYYNASLFLYQKAQAAQDSGDYFPIWGTCQGFQLLSIMTSGDENVLLNYAYDSENLGLALNLTEAAFTSRLFNSIPERALNILSTQNVTMNLHHDGVEPSSFLGGNEQLTSFFSLLSTNKDRKGKPFGSTIEAYDRPIYGVQWHPERNQFDWDLEESALSHTADAVYAMQSVANFIVNETRNNFHSFPTPQLESSMLIYNWNPYNTGYLTTESYPDAQTYVFVDLAEHMTNLTSSYRKASRH